MAEPLCIVAGVGPGVGLAVAKRFAKEGFSLALLARREDALKEFATEINSLGGASRGFPVDLTDGPALLSVMRRIEAEMGPASVLIYNASVWREADPLTFDPVVFTKDLALSATGALICTQAVHAGMAAAGGGTILFTGGGLALKPGFGTPVISLATGKAAVRALTFAMAPALAKEGIHLATVTIAGAVAPGTAFDPDLIAERFWTLHGQSRDAWQTEIIFAGA